MAQFASPEAILAMPEPDAHLSYAIAMRHYARALAQAQRRNLALDSEIAADDALGKSASLRT